MMQAINCRVIREQKRNSAIPGLTAAIFQQAGKQEQNRKKTAAGNWKGDPALLRFRKKVLLIPG